MPRSLASLASTLFFISTVSWGVEATPVAPVAAPAPARVAMIHLNEIHDDLLDLVIAKPENDALKKIKELNDANDLKRNQISQAGDKDGKTVEEQLKAIPDNNYQMQQKLERLVRAEILRMVTKKYGNRFTIVLDGDNSGSLVFVDGEIIDLTQTLKQAIQLNEF